MDFNSRKAVYMAEMLLEGMDRLLHGSYAERHPGLGKMVNCPLCGRRRREMPAEPCCNTAHSTTKRAWSAEKGFYQEECPPRVVENILSAAMKRKIFHKRHSNTSAKQIHDMNLALQDERARNTTQLLLEGLPGFWTPKKDVIASALPSFAARVVYRIKKAKAAKKRDQQKQSRRINRN